MLLTHNHMSQDDYFKIVSLSIGMFSLDELAELANELLAGKASKGNSTPERIIPNWVLALVKLKCLSQNMMYIDIDVTVILSNILRQCEIVIWYHAYECMHFFFIWFSLFSFWYPDYLPLVILGIDGDVRMEFGDQAHDQKATGRWRCLNQVVYTFLHHISPAPCDLIAKTPQIPTQIWSNMIKVDMQAYSDILGSPWQADQNQIFRIFPYSSK